MVPKKMNEWCPKKKNGSARPIIICLVVIVVMIIIIIIIIISYQLSVFTVIIIMLNKALGGMQRDCCNYPRVGKSNVWTGCRWYPGPRRRDPQR